MIFKKVFVLTLMIFMSFSYGFAGSGPDEKNDDQKNIELTDEPMDWYDADSEFEALFNVTGDQVIENAKKYLGRPYRHGSMGPSSFDCSGFTSYIYKCLNIRLNRTSQDQYRQGISVNKDELEVGDLVFFSNTNSSRRGISHVGIVYSIEPDGSFNFIHAACHSGITISNINDAYYARKYSGAKRIL